MKLGVNALAGEKIGEILLPSQTMFDKDNTATRYLLETQQARRVSVTTHDGATLDGVQFNNAPETDIHDQKHIINFVGNGMRFEQIFNEIEGDAEALKCNVIGFNYRGVSNSTGKAKSNQDLVNDGIAQVQRLIDQGADPEKITLKGHSLGSGIATLVAKHFHDHGLKINVFNGRSFSSVTNVVTGWLRTGGASGHAETIGSTILSSIAKPFMKFALALTKWEIDAASAYKALPDTHKEYMLVRSPKAYRQEHGDEVKDDPVIPHYGSLHAALKSERKAQKATFEKIKSDMKSGVTSLTHNEMQQSFNHVQIAKDQLKQRKMRLDQENKGMNGSVVPMDYLKDRYTGNDAHTFFRGFVQRATAHHDRVKTKNYRAK